MTNVLITGASGFVGRALFAKIKNTHKVDVLLRKHDVDDDPNVFIGEINSDDDYSMALHGKEIVVHCAARVHVMNDEKAKDAYRETNTLGTQNLALQAAKAGVKRFVFISSIKVNGEKTVDQAFTSQDKNQPVDDYGTSKSEAETSLFKIGMEAGMEIIVVRPPLVYGPGVKANFAALVKLIERGLPLPFGAINTNKRSMVYIENLIDFIVTIITFPEKINGVYLISDDDDLSTAQLVRKIAKGLDRRLLNIPIPVSIFVIIGKVIGKEAVVSRLVDSLQVDIESSKSDFSWTAPYSSDYGIEQTAKSFLNRD